MRKALSTFILAAAATCGLSATSAKANALLYSYETGDTPDSVDGFVKNGGPPTFTITQSTVGVTNGANSALYTVTPAGFASSYTQTIPAALLDPTTTDITFDQTVPSGFSYTGGYALIGVRFFIYNPTTADAEQFQVQGSSEQAIPFGSPGTTVHSDVPLIGADPLTGLTVPYSAILAEGYVPTGFDFFFDKNGPITVAIDNVVAVQAPEPTSLGLIAGAGALALGRRRRA